MKAITPRSITADEAAVINQALRRAGVKATPEDIIRTIISLRVIGECECGCRSIQFESREGEEYMLADGVGYLRNGERVDVIVWGRDLSIASLELVDHRGSGMMPEASTICS